MKSRVFDSMAQAAAALGVSKELLQTAKTKGCAAFRGGRVHEAEFLEWVKTHKMGVTPGEQLKTCLVRLGSEIVALNELALKNPDTFGWIGNLTCQASTILLAVRDECVADGYFEK